MRSGSTSLTSQMRLMKNSGAMTTRAAVDCQFLTETSPVR